MGYKIDYEINDELMYCNCTKQTAMVGPITFVFFLLGLVQLVIFGWFLGFWGWIGLLLLEQLLLRRLSKANIRFRHLTTYLRERRSNVRHARSSRQKILATSMKTMISKEVQ